MNTVQSGHSTPVGGVDAPVVGNGLIARHLRRIASSHHGVLFFASGVAGTTQMSSEGATREERMLGDALASCKHRGLRFVYFSSIGSLGPDDGSLRCEDDDSRPTTPYGMHKATMENLIRGSTVPYVIFRLAHLVGPDQNPAQLVPALALQVRHGEVSVAPNVRRDVLDVEDAVHLVDRVLKVSTRSDLVNIASGIGVSVRDLVTTLAELLGCSPSLRITSDAPGGYSADVTRLTAYVGTDAMSDFDVGYYRRALARYYDSQSTVEPVASRHGRGKGRHHANPGRMPGRRARRV